MWNHLIIKLIIYFYSQITQIHHLMVLYSSRNMFPSLLQIMWLKLYYNFKLLYFGYVFNEGPWRIIALFLQLRKMVC